MHQQIEKTHQRFYRALLFALIICCSTRAVRAQAQRTPPPSLETVHCLAFSPDGNKLAFAGEDTVVYFYNASNGLLHRMGVGHTDAIMALAYSPDGKKLATRGRDDTVKIWDAGSGEELQSFEAPTDRAAALAWSSDGKFLACDDSYSIRVLDAKSGATLQTLKGHSNWNTSLTFMPQSGASPLADALVSASADGTMRFWDVKSGKTLRLLKNDRGWIHTVSLSKSGRLLATCGDSGDQLWNARQGDLLRGFQQQASSRYWTIALSLRPDESLVAGATNKGAIYLWHSDDPRKQAILRGGKGWLRAVCWNPNGQRIASGGDDGVVFIYDFTTRRVVLKLSPPLQNTRRLAAVAVRDGMIFSNKGDYQQALASLERAAQLDATRAETWIQLSYVHINMHQYQKAVTIIETRLSGSKRTVDRTLLTNALTYAYDWIGYDLQLKRRFEESNVWYQKIVDLEESRRPAQAADSLQKMAANYQASNKNEKTQEYYERALQVSLSAKDKNAEAEARNLLGRFFVAISHYNQALSQFQQALALYQSLRDVASEGMLRHNIGQLYGYIGRNEDALRFLLAAVDLGRRAGDVKNEGVYVGDVGWAYMRMGEYAKSIPYFEKSLQLARSQKKRGDEISRLRQLALVHDALGAKDKSLAEARESLRVALLLEDDPDEELFARIYLGTILINQGQAQAALEQLQPALIYAQQLRQPEPKSRVLQQLMRAEQLAGVPRLAVFYGKQAINDFQEMRHFLPDAASQRSFAQSKESTYRTLADLLIGQRRIPEAEEVLEMLKQEEYFDFVRRDDKVADALLQGVEPNSEEAKFLQRYSAIADQLMKLGAEYSRLNAERLGLDPETFFTKQDQLNKLGGDLEDSRKTFRLFLGELKTEFGRENVRVSTVESGLQKDLKRWNTPGLTVISTITGKDHLNLIVTTADAQRAHRVEISEAELGKLIIEFRAVVGKDARNDPRPAGQRLYDVLVKPLESDLDLEGLGSKTLLWSLDGALRYVPVAALYDEKRGYLAEHCANVVITLASRNGLEHQPQSRDSWQALAMGVSRKYESFPALAAVPAELSGIVREKPSETGVVAGRRLLDDQFDYASFKDSMGRYPLVHIASHFSLRGKDDDSFLLLGGGEKRELKVADLRDMETIFNGVELLALSACNTATGGGGEEVEGFGMVAQVQGALAVLASLWSVADASTRDLMVNFYRTLESSDISKAEALRQAQLKLMCGEYSTPSEARRGVTIIRQEGEAPDFKPNPKAPYSHPYFWAPFILIGNWR